MEKICPPGYHNFNEAEDIYNQLFNSVFSYLKYSGIHGDILEFGSFKGYSARKIAQYINSFNYKCNLCLFDSWKGMPEINSKYDQESYEVAVLDDWKLGCYDVPAETPDIIEHDISLLIGKEHIKLVKGYYQDTLKDIHFAPQSLALVNIDCDLYDSIYIVLKKLIDEQAFMDGTVLLFDDYNFNRANPNMGARKVKSVLFNDTGRYKLSFFLNYSWHGRAFIVHDTEYELK